MILAIVLVGAGVVLQLANASVIEPVQAQLFMLYILIAVPVFLLGYKFFKEKEYGKVAETLTAALGLISMFEFMIYSKINIIAAAGAGISFISFLYLAYKRRSDA